MLFVGLVFTAYDRVIQDTLWFLTVTQCSLITGKIASTNVYISSSLFTQQEYLFLIESAHFLMIEVLKDISVYKVNSEIYKACLGYKTLTCKVAFISHIDVGFHILFK